MVARMAAYPLSSFLRFGENEFIRTLYNQRGMMKVETTFPQCNKHLIKSYSAQYVCNKTRYLYRYLYCLYLMVCVHLAGVNELIR